MNHSAPPRLLVVDDEPDLRTLYELTLVREGYDVESAGSVEEAWSALQQRSFAVVITDMRLPDGSPCNPRKPKRRINSDCWRLRTGKQTKRQRGFSKCWHAIASIRVH